MGINLASELRNSGEPANLPTVWWIMNRKGWWQCVRTNTVIPILTSNCSKRCIRHDCVRPWFGRWIGGPVIHTAYSPTNRQLWYRRNTQSIHTDADKKTIPPIRLSTLMILFYEPKIPYFIFSCRTTIDLDLLFSSSYVNMPRFGVSGQLLSLTKKAAFLFLVDNRW